MGVLVLGAPVEAVVVAEVAVGPTPPKVVARPVRLGLPATSSERRVAGAVARHARPVGEAIPGDGDPVRPVPPGRPARRGPPAHTPSRVAVLGRPRERRPPTLHLADEVLGLPLPGRHAGMARPWFRRLRKFRISPRRWIRNPCSMIIYNHIVVTFATLFRIESCPCSAIVTKPRSQTCQ